MTDEQVERLIAVQTAQLAMLEGIYQGVQCIAAAQGKAGTYNWDRVKNLLENAKAIRKG